MDMERQRGGNGVGGGVGFGATGEDEVDSACGVQSG